MSLKSETQEVCVEEIKKYKPGGKIEVVDVVVTLQFVLEELERTKDELTRLKKSLGG